MITKPDKSKFGKECDSLDIVYGGGYYDSKQILFIKNIKFLIIANDQK